MKFYRTQAMLYNVHIYQCLIVAYCISFKYYIILFAADMEPVPNC